jgi:hypothetical protein
VEAVTTFITPDRTHKMDAELEALAACAEKVEKAEERLTLRLFTRDLAAALRVMYRVNAEYEAARKALDARARELAIGKGDALKVDPVTVWDTEDDVGDLPVEDPRATQRARLKAREQRLAATGPGGRKPKGKEPGTMRWAAKPVMVVGDLDRRALS